jgi:PAS domain S-box-containing protein
MRKKTPRIKDRIAGWSASQPVNAAARAPVDRDAAALLYRHGSGGIAVSVAASAFLTMLPGPDTWGRALWFGVVCGVLCLRGCDIFLGYKQSAQPDWDGRRAIRRFGFGVVVTGALWAAFPLLFFSSLNETGRMALAVILSAMAGGSTTVLAAEETLARAYCALLLLPASFMFVLAGGRESTSLGLLGGLYFLVMAASARVTHRATMSAVVLSHKNEALMQRMDEEQQRTESANTELRRAEAALHEANQFLESRIKGRTAELEGLNERLRAEIAQRRNAQEALANSEAHFRTVIENASDVIYVSNAEGTIEYVSPTVTRVLGYEPDEIIGKGWAEFTHADDTPRAMERFKQGLSMPNSHAPLELQARHKNGSVLLVEAIGNNQLYNPAVRGIVVTIRDITDRRRLEDQFRQAQKMEALGRLAGGVAHDFNNLLTVICGYSELLAKRLPEGSALRRHAEQVHHAGGRATGLVQQLLAFSRKQVIQPAVLDLNEAVADLEKMLRRLIGEDVELTIAPWREPLCVLIDRTQFDQIVMNLSVNSRDAMPKGGALTISVHPHAARGGFECRDCPIARGDFMVLEVADTGTGMTDETRAHIFEPFFTTKEVGRGTGLGLSMVYGAVQQAGGHICLDTQWGKGTTFRICLPRVEKPAPAPEHIEGPANKGGQETILLVEDEDLVRTMLQEALEEAGYRVLAARHGEHALEVARQNETAIDLVVTDVVMPKMSGPDLVARLATVRPETKVLFVSGYSRQELAPGCNFLKKPFTPEELILKVRSVLDRAPRR